MVKRAYLKPVTFLRAICEVVEEDEDNKKDNLIQFDPKELIPNCEKHEQNKIFYYCIDCDKIMCPACILTQG